jgi:hypothetical protein
VFLDEPGGSYWKDWQEFILRNLLKTSMISPADQSLYKLTESVEAAVEEIMHFYRTFHSMRFVRKQLVFRLQHRLSDATLEMINAEFTDLLAGGKFEQREALKEEADEYRVVTLPRLAFQFNRRNFGRLRELIDAINASAPPELASSPTA